MRTSLDNFITFQEIIFDLLGCNRAHSVLKSSIYPERMNIGIRALMVIANSLQQKEGPPDMPHSMGKERLLVRNYIPFCFVILI